MAYNTKYYLDLGSRLGKNYQVRLKKLGYADNGTQYPLTGRVNPVTISDDNTDGYAKLVPVRGQYANIHIAADTAGKDARIKADLKNITDREFSVEIVQLLETASLQGHCTIDELLIAAEPEPPEGFIQITHLGGLEFIPTCILFFTIDLWPDEFFPQYLDFYAFPGNKNNDWPDRKHLGGVLVEFGDDEDSIKVKILALGPEWEWLEENTYRYSQTTLDDDIDSSWTVGLTYREDIYHPKAYFWQSWRRFTGATESQFIKLFWHTYSPTGVPVVTEIAKAEFEEGETLETVAQQLVDNINGTAGYRILADQYIPLTDEIKDIRLIASRIGAYVKLTLWDITAAEGNSIIIREADENDTYLRVEKSANAEYTYNLSGFDSGVDTGDTFTIEILVDGYWITLATIRSIPLESEADIILRLVAKVSSILNWKAWVDPLDSASMYIETKVGVADGYQFLTEGDSTVSDDGPDFAEGEALEQIVFEGWVLPYMYEQEHLPSQVRINLTAVCGLGDIKNVKFPVNPALQYRMVTYMEVIVDILSTTGLFLDIYDATNLWEVYMDMDVSPLLQTYIDSSQYTGRKCNEVLEEVMFLCKSTLVQHLGRWEMVPLELQEETSYTYRIFDHLGNLKGTVLREDFHRSIGGNTRDAIMLGASTRLGFAESMANAEFTQDYGYSPQQLGFPEFDLFNDNFGGGGTILYPWKWMKNNINQTSFLGKVRKGDNGYLTMQDATGQDDIFYIYQKGLLGDVPKNTENKQYELEIHVKNEYGNNEAADSLKFRLTSVDQNGDEICLSQEVSTGWLPISGGGVVPDIEILAKEGDTDNVWRFAFNISLIADIGSPIPFELIIWQPAEGEGYVSIKSIKLTVRSEVEASQLIESEYEATAPYITGKTLEKTITMGDVPNVLYASQMYHFGLYRMVGGYPVPTRNWITPDEVGELGSPILNILQKYALDIYSLPPTLLTLNVYGDVDGRSILRDASDSNYLFMFVTSKWNLVMDTVDGVVEQIRMSDLIGLPSTLRSESKPNVRLTPYLSSTEINNQNITNTTPATLNSLFDGQAEGLEDEEFILSKTPSGIIIVVVQGAIVSPSRFTIAGTVLTFNWQLGENDFVVVYGIM